MIYLNNFDLLKEKEQLYNTCSSYMNTSEQVKLKKESSEIKKSIIQKKKQTKTFEKKNIMISNIFSKTVSNMTELTSSSAQILTQMQACIEQLEEQHQQQNLKIDKSDQFNRTKKSSDND